MAGRFSAARRGWSLRDALLVAHRPPRVATLTHSNVGRHEGRARDGILLRLYNRHAAASAAAWQRRRFRLTGAGRMSRIWAMSGYSEPIAPAGVGGNVAEVDASIAIPGESALGSIQRIASGGISLDLCKIYRPLLGIFTISSRPT